MRYLLILLASSAFAQWGEPDEGWGGGAWGESSQVSSAAVALPAYVGVGDGFGDTADGLYAFTCFYAAAIDSPMVRLYRGTTGDSLDFYPVDDASSRRGHLDTTGYAAWAGAETISVLRWFDQSGNEKDLQQSAVVADRPLFSITGATGSEPTITFDYTVLYGGTSTFDIGAAGEISLVTVFNNNTTNEDSTQILAGKRSTHVVGSAVNGYFVGLSTAEKFEMVTRAGSGTAVAAIGAVIFNPQTADSLRLGVVDAQDSVKIFRADSDTLDTIQEAAGSPSNAVNFSVGESSTANVGSYHGELLFLGVWLSDIPQADRTAILNSNNFNKWGPND